MKSSLKLAIIPIICLLFIASTVLFANNRQQHNPFFRLFNQLNQLLDEQHNESQKYIKKVVYQHNSRNTPQQQPTTGRKQHSNTHLAFSNDPFNDPFFSDPFNDPFFKKFFENENPNNEEDVYYIVIRGDDQNQTNTTIQRVQPKSHPSHGKPKTNQPKRIQFKPTTNKPNSPFNFLPLGNQHQHNQFGQSSTQKFSQYKPENDKKAITFKDVLGQQEAIKEVADIVDFLKNPAKYHKLGAEIPKGVLFQGPPGTGKTMLARAVANEAGCTFIHAAGSQFINKYVGTGADNIRKLFEQARSQAPAIIFIDELDAIGSRKRDENQEYRHTINELLSQMDGFTQDDNVIVLAATNYQRSLDNALLRPGRFDRIVKFGLPNRKGREDLLSYYMKKKLLNPSIDVAALANEFSQRTPGFSGAEIKKLANEAALLACREDAENLSIEHFEQAYDKVVLGPKNHFDRTAEQLKRTAYHEVGHLVVKLLTNNPVAKVSILSRGDTLGVTFEKEKYETMSEYQKEELKQKIMGLYGGFVAEKHFMHCTRPGASHDLEQIRKIAQFMIRDCGMGDGELEGVACSNQQFRDFPDRLKNKIVAAELKLMNECKVKTEKLLAANEKLVHALAAELIKKETLNEAAIRVIYDKIKASDTTGDGPNINR